MASFLVLESHLVVIFDITVMSSNINIVSWNVRGQNSKFKKGTGTEIFTGPTPPYYFPVGDSLYGQ